MKRRSQQSGIQVAQSGSLKTFDGDGAGGKIQGFRSIPRLSPTIERA